MISSCNNAKPGYLILRNSIKHKYVIATSDS